MANWLKRFLNLDEPAEQTGGFDDRRFAPPPLPTARPMGPPSYAPAPPRRAAPQAYGPPAATPELPPYVPPSEQPGYVGPPTRKPVGTYAPNEVIPVSEAARMWVRGSLPPQGLAPFVRELRSVGDQVADFYVGWTKFIWGDLIPKALPEPTVVERRGVANGGTMRPITIERQPNGESTPIRVAPRPPADDSFTTPTLDGE
jgi:hypothetical protein